MPALARYALVWSTQADGYELRDGSEVLDAAGSDVWVRWLDEHSSFSFRGREGRLNLLKEGRKGGSGYWYAYRRQGKHTLKRYAGRSAELTFERLEELAQALEDVSPSHTGVPQPQEARGAAGDGVNVTTPEPLLVPKLQPPRLHGPLVKRDRLLAQLDAGREGKLILVNGPAGFGKTTLVLQWLAEAARRDRSDAVAWLSLDRGDNDPLRFWRYLITACRALGPEVGGRSLSLLEAPLSIKSPLEMSLAAFVNELAQAGREGILVLEDYHVITSPQIHETVISLLEHLPWGLHLLLITRTTPPLPLARLRAAGELVEIEAPELRFSEAETEAFFKKAVSVDLPSGEIARIEASTEGWAAGLRLLALALAGRQDPGEIGLVLENFVAGRRGIGDYFVAEVLNGQPSPVQLFLLQTSLLGRLTAPLCDRVTGRNDSGPMLEMLDRANLFVEPLDASGLWYRYHALFAAAMQGEARRRLGERTVRALQERAGRWYEEHAMLGEAIEATFAADNPRRAADLIEVAARKQFDFELPEMQAPPEFYTMRSWLTRLPEAVINKRPLLHLSLAVTTLFTYLVDMRPTDAALRRDIEGWLAKAERGFRATGEMSRLGQLFAFRALMLREQGEIAAAAASSRAALDHLPLQDRLWRSICVSTLGVGEFAAGRLGDAATLLIEARTLCEALGNQPLARGNSGMLASVYLEQNELNRAAALLRQILSEARAVNDLEDVGWSLQKLAEIDLCRNHLDAAEAKAWEVVEIMRPYPHELSHINAVLILARVEQARGRHEAALARCEALLTGREPASSVAAKQLDATIEFELARIALAAGDLATAQRWHAHRPTGLELPRVQRDHEEILLGRLLLAEGDPAAALRLLRRLLSKADANGRDRVALETRVVLALACVAHGSPDLARQSLAEALAKAQPEHEQGVFLDYGEPLAALLRSILPTLDDGNQLSFAKTVLRPLLAAGPKNHAIVEPLSHQERRVLRLIAAGLSNGEIAVELVVSVNTVKAHVKHIYRKLNVGSRLKAASAARELGLL